MKMSGVALFEDIFEVCEVDIDGKKFEKGMSLDMDLMLNVCSQQTRVSRRELRDGSHS